MAVRFESDARFIIDDAEGVIIVPSQTMWELHGMCLRTSPARRGHRAADRETGTEKG